MAHKLLKILIIIAIACVAAPWIFTILVVLMEK
jgi:hypothetical protein